MAGALIEAAYYYTGPSVLRLGNASAISTYLESKAPCVAHDPSVGALAVMENIFHF